MERVSDVSRVVVGRFYLVPSVEIVNPRGSRRVGGKEMGHVPVIGPMHEDAAVIGLDDEHLHVDWRFVTQRQVHAWAKSGAFWATEPLNPRALAQVLFASEVGPIEERRHKALREMPTFPWVGYWQPDLENAYADRRLKPDCRTCPHRGVPLNGLPEVDGKVVCPGHGLQWDTATGALVRRAPGAKECR